MSRLAVNPIQYWARAGRTREVLDAAFAELSAIGFTAVKADVPEGMTAAAYLDWLDGYGLAPSVSLFNSAFDETVDIAAETERAKRFAATQVELGLDRTMVSSVAVPARMERPAVGADFSRSRLNLAIENCGVICQVLQAEGLRPLHHSHVGGVFETEREITALLDDLGADLIGIGPDTGHLRWAGVDPVGVPHPVRRSGRRDPPEGRLRRLPGRTGGGGHLPRAGRLEAPVGRTRTRACSTSPRSWPRCRTTTTAT